MVREVTFQGIKGGKKLSFSLAEEHIMAYMDRPRRLTEEERKKLSSARRARLYDPNPPADYMPGATPKPDNRTQSELAMHGCTVVNAMVLASMFIAGFLPTTQGHFDHVDVAWFFWE